MVAELEWNTLFAFQPKELDDLIGLSLGAALETAIVGERSGNSRAQDGPIE